MSLLTVCQWIQGTQLSLGIREGAWVFPLLNFGHMLGMSLMFGTIAFVDLRLIGLALRKRAVSDVVDQLLPFTWIGWTIMLITGAFIFWSEPVRCYLNDFFRIKILLMALAGLNALVFHFAQRTPRQRLWAGAISLSLWTGVVIAGRAIAYTSY